MKSHPRDAADFTAKLEALLENHRQFASEFARSLENARHFIALADRSMEQEPEDTISMLNQIREIDLLGHLQRLAEEFQGVRGFLSASPYWSEARAFAGELEELAERYETLQKEAAEQLNSIEVLLNGMAS
jgi:ribosomal protein L16 Arg81 hydroxylase